MKGTSRTSLPSMMHGHVPIGTKHTSLVLGFVVIFASLFAEATTLHLESEWSTARNVFSPREKQAVTCVANETVLAFGGIGGQGRTTELWFLNTSTAQWTQGMPVEPPVPLDAATMVALGDRAYLFGGQEVSSKASGKLYDIGVADLSNGAAANWWRLLQTTNDGVLGWTPGPDVRYRHAAVALSEERMAVAFGLNEVLALNDVWTYNATSGAWTQEWADESYPEARYNPCCGYHKGQDELVCFGGTGLSGDIADTIAFSFATRTWRTLQVTSGEGPSARRLAQCTLTATDLVVYGGFSSLTGLVEDDAPFVYELATGRWSSPQSTTLPAARSGGSMVTCAGQVWLFGGTNEVINYNDLWTYDTTDHMFTSIEDTSAVPAMRLSHLAALHGPRMYVLLGEDATGAALEDVWSYDVAAGAWQLEQADLPFEPRVKMAGAAGGPLVWVTGGLVSGRPTQQVIVYDVVSREWTAPNINGEVSPLTEHAATYAQSHVIVFGGRTSSGGAPTNAAWMLSVFDLRWFALVPDGVVPPARRGHTLTFDSVTNESLIVGGFGRSATLFDRWTMTVGERINETAYRVTYRELAAVAAHGFTEDHRTQAAAVQVASRVFVLGGAIGNIFPPARENSSFAYDTESGVSTPLRAMPVQVFEASAVYYRNTFVVYGGGVAVDGVKRPGQLSSAVQLLQLPAEAMCGAGVTSDDDCVYCALGTAAPGCVPVQEGFYRPSFTRGALPCPRGTYGGSTGLVDETSCGLCAGGTYNNLTGQAECTPCPSGMTCLIGSVNPQDGSFQPQSSVESEQPGVLQPDLPLSATALGAILFSIAFFGTAVAAAFLKLDTSTRARFRRHYLQGAAEDEVRMAFRRVALDRPEIPPRELMNVLRLVNHTSRLRAERVQEVLDALHAKLGSYSKLSPRKVQDFIIAMIVCGELAPFPGSPAAAGEPFRKACGKVPEMRSLDSYAASHKSGMGESPVIRKTTLGGLFSVWAKFLLIAYIVLQVLNFGYLNLVETRSILPTMVEPVMPVASVEASVTLFGPSADACVGSAEWNSGVCNPSSAFYPTNIVGAANSTRCDYRQDRDAEGDLVGLCTMSWSCTACTMTLSNASLEFYFGDSQTYSTMTVARLATQSGVDGKWSRTAQELSVPSAKQFLQGYPGTRVVASVLRTVMEAEDAIMGGNPTTTDGFHVAFEPKDAVAGNVVNSRTYSLFTGVPVTIVLDQQANTLFVRRKAQQTLLGFVGALLGGSVGLLGLFVGGLGFIEGLTSGRKEKQREQQYDALMKHLDEHGTLDASSVDLALLRKPVNEPTGLYNGGTCEAEDGVELTEQFVREAERKVASPASAGTCLSPVFADGEHASSATPAADEEARERCMRRRRIRKALKEEFV